MVTGMPTPRLLLLVLLLSCAVRPGAAQSDRLRAAVEALVAPYQALAMFDGVVLLARSDTVVHHAAYGVASAEWSVPLTPGARFRIASISKAFTAVAVGTLIERGLLAPTTTLDAFAPTIPDAGRITVAQLVSHRAGIVHLNNLPAYDVVMRGGVSLDSLVRWVARQPLDFPPGSAYRYSNGGYALLAHLIEAASGQSYGAYLAEHVLEPLGLRDTEHEQLGRLQPHLARGYQPGPAVGERVPAAYVAPDVKIGGGSLVSSAPDLLRFARALDDGTLLPRATVDSLLGAGPVRYLSGRAPGYNAVVMRDRQGDRTVVVLSNAYTVTANSLAPALMALLNGEPSAPPVLVPAASAVDWSGRYRWPPNFDNTFVLRLEGEGWLYDEGAAGDRTAAVPLSDGTLLLPMYDVRCTPPGANGDLSCTAPWSGERLVLARRYGE